MREGTVIFLILAVTGCWWLHGRDRDSDRQLSKATIAVLEQRVAAARAVRYQRVPLFSGQQTVEPGNAMVDYLAAARLGRALIGDATLPPFVFDERLQKQVPEAAVVTTPGARKVAELVVQGADRDHVAWISAEVDWPALDQLIDMVLATGLDEYRHGDPRQAYRYVAATQRMLQDLVRASEATAPLMLELQLRHMVALVRYFVTEGKLDPFDLAALFELETRLVAHQASLREVLLSETAYIDSVFLEMVAVGMDDWGSDQMVARARRRNGREAEGVVALYTEQAQNLRAIAGDADAATVAVEAIMGCQRIWRSPGMWGLSAPCRMTYALVEHTLRNQVAERSLLGEIAVAMATSQRG